MRLITIHFRQAKRQRSSHIALSAERKQEVDPREPAEYSAGSLGSTSCLRSAEYNRVQEEDRLLRCFKHPHAELLDEVS